MCDFSDMTVDEAAKSAMQAELICSLMMGNTGGMTEGEGEIESLLALIKQLTGKAGSWLIAASGDDAICVND
ncbi:hypothetical protein ABMH19_004943 [Escherichia coli]